MNINIYGKQVEVTPAIEAYIKDKFSNAHKPEKLQQVSFKIGVEKNTQFVHFDAHVHKEHIFVEAEHDNLYAAIDLLMDKIKGRFKKLKEKPEAARRHRTDSELNEIPE